MAFCRTASDCLAWAGYVREPPDMMSAKFLDFLKPLPTCLHMKLICSIRFMQPPVLRPLFHDPPPMWTSYLEAPLCAVTRGGRAKRGAPPLSCPPPPNVVRVTDRDRPLFIPKWKMTRMNEWLANRKIRLRTNKGKPDCIGPH